jgi:hypothetical protein
MSKSSTPRVAAKTARGVRGKTAAKNAREKARTAPASHPSTPKVVTADSNFDAHHDAGLIVGTICSSASVTPKTAQKR